MYTQYTTAVAWILKIFKIKHKNKPIAKIPDLGHAHGTYDGVKLVLLVPNPTPMSGKKKT